MKKILNSAKRGLTTAEANERLRKIGPNVVSSEFPSVLDLIGRQILTPLSLMLFAASALSYTAGESFDALIILSIFGVNAAFSFFQEFRAEATVKELTKRLHPSVRVLRDGTEVSVPAREIVPGDVVLLEAGDLVPADVRVMESNDLMIDESILSGESAPVSKSSKVSSILFGGTAVLSGSVTAVVFATGLKTEAGRIMALAVERTEPSAFELLIGKLNVFILRITAAAICFVFIAQLILREGISIPERLLFFVALAIMMVPEGLPAVVTITFARGAAKLAKRSVLVRRLSAIEELGHVNVLCVDKTGTLTEGTMTVSDVEGDAKLLSKFISITAGRHVPHTTSGVAYEEALAKHFHGHARGKVIAVLPFDPIRRRSSKLIEMAGKRYIFVQGAPENVLEVSTRGANGELDRKHWMETYRAMGEAGERTLAFAYRETTAQSISPAGEGQLIFLGMVGFIDPIRRTAEAAILAAKALHVDVKILSGDSVEVALAVARKVGLVPKHARAVTGDEFSKASREERLMLVRECSVFARISPAEKHAIVKLIESDGKRVAFMGDGMNDAPALRAAHVGLAVSTAADISKGAADIVLLKSDLHVIVQAIGYGREIFANVRKYLYSTLVGNFGNFLTVSILSLWVPFLPLLPVQILLLNLLTDVPMVAVASDSVDKEDRATPRAFSMREILLVTVVLGAVSSVFDFASFAAFHALSPDRVRTLWFIVSVFTELLLLFSLRTWHPVWRAGWPSLSLTVITVFAAITTAILPFTQFGQTYFQFSAPTPVELVLIIALAAVYFGATEAVKLALRNRLPKVV